MRIEMKTKTRKSPTKPESVEEILANARPVGETLRELREAAGTLDEDPEFIAEGLKIRFVHNILSAMRKAGISKSDLARKLGKSRQYVGRVLDEEEGENFTLETMAAFACAVGLRLDLRMPFFGETASIVAIPTVVEESVTQTFKGWGGQASPVSWPMVDSLCLVDTSVSAVADHRAHVA